MAGARELTIGEAAACLAVEFPGVTAAVLRRLESAGKFTAARTGAGYRRYSGSDLDLIRIVLASGGAGDAGEDAGPSDPEAAPQRPDLSGPEAARAQTDAPSGADDGAQRPAGARTAVRAARAGASRVPAARGSGTGRTQAPAIAALFDVPPGGGNGNAPTTHLPGHVSGQVPGPVPVANGRSAYSQAQTQAQASAIPSQLAAAGPAARGRRAARYAEVSQRSESGQVAREAAATVYAPPAPAGAPAPSAQLSSRTPVPGSARPSAAAPTAAPAAPSPSARRADRRWPDAEFFTPDLGEVSLDLDQLAAAARTDRAWVDGLVEYGVLPSSDSAGGADLLVARASAELAQFGVEPRHLRAVAASAARVAELIAAATTAGTVRDPARRERAALAAPGRSAEAAAAAVRLHAALVRAALLRG